MSFVRNQNNPHIKREHNVVTDYNFKIRCVSGAPVPYPDGALVPGNGGWARITLQGLTELMELTQWWSCPVTISPPEGTEATGFWCVELEDGLHAAAPILECEGDEE